MVKQVHYVGSNYYRHTSIFVAKQGSLDYSVPALNAEIAIRH